VSRLRQDLARAEQQQATLRQLTLSGAWLAEKLRTFKRVRDRLHGIVARPSGSVTALHRRVRAPVP